MLLRELRREAGLDPCAIHTPYLINLASADPKIAQGSLRLLQNDLAVAARGGMRFVNTHLGSYGTRDRAEAFDAICQRARKLRSRASSPASFSCSKTRRVPGI